MCCKALRNIFILRNPDEDEIFENKEWPLSDTADFTCFCPPDLQKFYTLLLMSLSLENGQKSDDFGALWQIPLCFPRML